MMPNMVMTLYIDTGNQDDDDSFKNMYLGVLGVPVARVGQYLTGGGESGE